MLDRMLLALWLAGSAIALPSIPPQTCKYDGKSGLAPVVPPCDFSYGGYHVICARKPFQTAAEACEAEGWRLAEVTDATAPYVQSTLDACVSDQTSIEGAWLASMNGYPSDPCMIAQQQGIVLAGLGGYCAADNAQPVLCQELPVVVSTSRVVTTWPVIQGTRTVTTTVTSWDWPVEPESPEPARRRPNSSSDLDDFKRALNVTAEGERQKGHRPVCEGCVEVCPFQINGFRIIRKLVPYLQADRECRERGWRLASVTSGRQRELADLLQYCQINMEQEPQAESSQSSAEAQKRAGAGEQLPPPSPRKIAGYAAWIDSYNGVGGETCMALVAPSGSAAWGLGTPGCASLENELLPFILCETECVPLPPENGPYVGPSTATTTTTSSTLIVVRPLTTVTETITVTRDPCHRGRCHRRP